MKKIILISGIVIIVLIVVALIGVGLFIGPIVKAGIETVGPQITKVPVKVDAVNISLLNGSAQLKSFIVGNPEGYSQREAIKVANASIKLDPWSVFSKKIVIRSIHIESPEILFESGLTGNNLSKIMDNVNSTAKADRPSTPATKEKPEGGDIPVQLDDFLIVNAKVQASISGLADKEITQTIPRIHLSNLGQNPEGITITELIRTVLNSIVTSTLKAVSNSAVEGGSGIDAIKKGIGEIFGK